MNARERLLAEGPRVAPAASGGAPEADSHAFSVRRWIAPFLPALITFGPFFLIVRFVRPAWLAAIALPAWLFVIRRFVIPLLRRWNSGN